MNPSDENALLLQAISLARSGRKEDAHAILHKIVGENPQSEMGWLWLVQTEPDPAQQILILEECLRNIPKSDYAKKGLANLRAQMRAHPAPPPLKPPTPPDSPKPKSKQPSRRPSGIWKVVVIVMVLALLGTLIGGGVLLFPLYKNDLPTIHLPIIPLGTRAPKVTRTATPAIPSRTATFTLSATPTVTRTPTVTFTPSLTHTPTITPTPTLFVGTPAAGEPALLFIKSGGCEVAAVPVSGGPQTLAAQPLSMDCADPKISPDGLRIGFITGPNREILAVAGVDGTGVKQVVKLAKGTGFDRSVWSWQWSPDGKSIALVAPSLAKDSPGFLFLGASNGSTGLRQIKNGGIQNSPASPLLWSPDGKWIFAWDMGLPDQVPYPSAFRTSDSRSVIISYLKDVPTLTPDYRFDWSPDSQFLSFIATQKPVTDALPTDIPQKQAYIVIAGMDKSLKYIPLPMAAGDFDPAFGALWSPDASSFLLLEKHTNQLVLIGTDGLIESRLMTLEDSNDPPIVQWSPDGKWISILESGKQSGSGSAVEIIRPDGSDFRILATGAALQPIVWK